MSTKKEQCLIELQKDLKKSLKLLSIPENTLNELEEIAEEFPEKRDSFIKNKFETHLMNLKETGYCIIPSILGPNHFTMVMRIQDKINKVIGSVKEDHFEMQYYDHFLIHSPSLKECLERVILYFEKQSLIPVLFDKHRDEVENNVHQVFDEALENNHLERIKSLIANLHVTEIEEELFFKAFEISSFEIIEYLITNLRNQKLRFRKFAKEKTNQEKFLKIINCVRKRLFKPDPTTEDIVSLIHNYLEQEYPTLLTPKILEEDNILREFVNKMIELSELKNDGEENQKLQDKKHGQMKETRADIEREIRESIEYFKKSASFNLNTKIGSEGLFPLDIALMKGSYDLIKYLIEHDADPSSGWKNETLDNFRAHKNSAVAYLVSKGERTPKELQDISALIETTLQTRN